ncbi:MAG TPA: hypothetical protein PKN80_06180 [bacterium]|uniref:Hydrogenase nickel incorporation protein HypA n=1 Tax=candidate division TA06 bacterium ADurb.Bin417 TaxID=1852828 RepID=A0A1V5M9N5_UNCT6|nr:MAG: hypothetical protein BWY73_01432 [candidate division TA06 bacterium ADurb.Bin417]HNQ35636.1 hypothetical protein [bacterium]HNS47965.1 hypothetical protein [bacterium]
MIPIDLSLAIGLYLFLALGVLVVFWVTTDSRRRTRDFHLEESHHWQCGLCFHRYVDSVAERFSRCPRCGNLNHR